MYFANSNLLKRDIVRPDGCNSLTLEQATFESPCRKEVRNTTEVVKQKIIEDFHLFLLGCWVVPNITSALGKCCCFKASVNS